jgi:hypothetical protein
MWHWRRMDISWTDRVIDEEVLQRVKEKRNILHTINGRKANWIGSIFCRHCVLKQILKTEGRIEVTGRRGRRRKQLLYGLKITKGYRILKEEALDRILWRTCYGPNVRLQNE